MPLHKVSSHSSKCPSPWFTNHISELISLIKHKADKSKDPDDQSTLTKLKNHVKGDCSAGETCSPWYPRLELFLL